MTTPIFDPGWTDYSDTGAFTETTDNGTVTGPITYDCTTLNTTSSYYAFSLPSSLTPGIWLLTCTQNPVTGNLNPNKVALFMITYTSSTVGGNTQYIRVATISNVSGTTLGTGYFVLVSSSAQLTSVNSGNEWYFTVPYNTVSGADPWTVTCSLVPLMRTAVFTG